MPISACSVCVMPCNSLASYSVRIPVPGPNVPKIGLESAMTLTWNIFTWKDCQAYCKAPDLSIVLVHKEPQSWCKTNKTW